MIGIGGAIPTSSRWFWFPDRSEKGLFGLWHSLTNLGRPRRSTDRAVSLPRPSRRVVRAIPASKPSSGRARSAADHSSGRWNGGFAPKSGCSENRPGVWRGLPTVAHRLRPPASACVEHCSLSTTSVDRRGPPPMPRAELGIHGLNR